MRYRTFILIVAPALMVGTQVSSQLVTLPADAEYQGALLKAGEPTRFSPTGRITEAVLKTDYARDGFIFAAGTAIGFEPTGKVVSGTLKQDTAFGKFIFTPGLLTFYATGQVKSAGVRAGGADRNLVIPTDGSLDLSAAGTVTGFRPRAIAPYRLFNRTLMSAAIFHFDERSQTYLLHRGAAGAAQVVGRAVLKRDSDGNPTQSVPVILPAGTAFTLLSDPAGLPSEFHSNWHPSSFVLNGTDFGPTPEVWVRDMRVEAVRISRDLTIGGVTYRGGSRVALDEAGKPIPPSR